MIITMLGNLRMRVTDYHIHDFFGLRKALRKAPLEAILEILPTIVMNKILKF